MIKNPYTQISADKICHGYGANNLIDKISEYFNYPYLIDIDAGLILPAAADIHIH
jgi:hypothetical protein